MFQQITQVASSSFPDDWMVQTEADKGHRQRYL